MRDDMKLLSYLDLTKPRISILFAWTGLAAILLEGSWRLSVTNVESTLGSNMGFRIFMVCIGIFLVGGGANSLNQYFERDLDKKMMRTAKKRPLPLGKIKPADALWFGIILCGLGLGVLWVWGSLLSTVIGLLTIMYYSFFYTLWLKPKTPYNIVIGGAAGATGPLMGWAAAAHGLSWEPWLMFLLIFFWTPPHFWALSLYIKEDYEKVSLPMYPLIYGEKSTRKQILGYSIFLLPLSLVLGFFPGLGWLYLSVTAILGIVFIAMAWNLYSVKLPIIAKRLFGYSILYMLVIFTVMIIEALL